MKKCFVSVVESECCNRVVAKNCDKLKKWEDGCEIKEVLGSGGIMMAAVVK